MSQTTLNAGLRIGRFSLGMGDRFGLEAEGQLRACIMAAQRGVDIVPVWNKSDREHQIIGSEPSSVRAAAEAAIEKLGWMKAWHVDADHIRLETANRFLSSSDFFTMDVASCIGRAADSEKVEAFVKRHREFVGRIDIPGVEGGIATNRSEVESAANKFLLAAEEAGKIYRHIEQAKGKGAFIPEASMDETGLPQTPIELLIILAALADEGVPVQTIAPKFTGRFNKGVDYAGDLAQFEREFNNDLCIIKFAIQKLGLPDNLKLSVHSGSDKFSLYPVIRRALNVHGAGLHLKTAGTTWLEEVIGLAEAGGEGLTFAKDIYAAAASQREELCAPYASVIDIDPTRLPAVAEVLKWSSEQYVNALRHERSCKEYNPHFRQLLHVGYKIAAQQGRRYLDIIQANHVVVSKNVTHNLYDRHIRAVFVNE